MTTLVRDRPVTTREPTLVIDPGLAAGSHRFRLEVIDSAGLRSAADVATVTVQRQIVVRPPVVTPPVVLRPPVVVTRPPVAAPPVKAAGEAGGPDGPPHPASPSRHNATAGQPKPRP